MLIESQSESARKRRLEIALPPGPRLGNLVVEADGVTKAFGDKLLFDNLTFNLPRNGIVGIIGANGAGKTTLFKMLTGEETPDSGALKVRETVQFAHVGQLRSNWMMTKAFGKILAAATISFTLGRGGTLPRVRFCVRF